MIVPEYWSEAKERVVIDGRSRTLKRFGWSDASEADALAHAKQRVQTAANRLREGETVRTMDHKVPYNGAEGLPIREEIVSRHGDSVVTRNAYGALCLNTPDTLFADVDVENATRSWLSVVYFLPFVIAGIFFSREFGTYWVLAVAALVGLIVSGSLASGTNWLLRKAQPDPFVAARAKIERFAEANPDWHLRLYRTPAGYRVLVMHRTFDPTADEAFVFLDRIGSDPLYVRMCRNQKCFRARLSPKPWRIGMADHIKPRPGVWPIRPERLPQRREWIRRYEDKARNFASCRFEEHLGAANVDRKCASVRTVHDSLSRAEQDLPIA